MPTRINAADTARPLRGRFTMRVRDKDGNILSTYEDHNMIVNSARVAMAMLVSENAPDKMITKFAVGTNNATATPTDTEITNTYANDIVGHSFPEPGTVKFEWRLDYDEANEQNITEFGLLCNDGTLFSRKVRSAIYKASDISFEGEWSIIF